ncbi:MAG: hypothetical protein RIR18_645 [Pseudomonadota bacterium]|jgi:uncharacterized membrane protein YsdA (DUF1294 family)
MELLPIKNELNGWLGWACLTVSLLAFAMYWADKKAALRNERRIPELRLLLVGVLGGWPGALLAQQLFRHKTKKTSFRVVFWLTVILNVAIVASLEFVSMPTTARSTAANNHQERQESHQ